MNTLQQNMDASVKRSCALKQGNDGVIHRTDASSLLTVYTASAGSGKTYTLSAEYIACLLSPEKNSHRRVLAVTFTNKATGEMKERILQYLYSLSKGLDADFLEDVLALRPDLRNMDVEHLADSALQDILHDYDHFFVETIDKFFQSLLSNLAHELGLSPRLRVDLNDNEVTEKAVKEMLTELNEDSENAEQKRLLGRVKRYILHRMSDNNTWQLGRDLTAFAQQNVLSAEYQKNAKELVRLFNEDDEGADDADTEVVDGYTAKLRRKYREVSEGGAVYTSLQERVAAIRRQAEMLDRSSWKNKGKALFIIFDTLSTISVQKLTESQRSKLENPEALIPKAALSDTDLVNATASITSAIKSLLPEIEEAETSRNTCRLILDSLDQLRLLDDVARHITRINAEADRFLLKNTKFIFNLLVTDADAEFVFEKEGYQFRNVLIDEFQDTARMQWENMRKLLVESTGTGNRSLIVGDVKQSIYRWNGGDWSILQNIDNEVYNITPRHETLNKNFRSQGHIVRFNNKFFAHAAMLLDKIDDTDTIQKIYGVKSAEEEQCLEGCVVEPHQAEQRKGADNVYLEQKVMREEDGGYVKVISYVKTRGTKAEEVPPALFNPESDVEIVKQVRELHAAGIPYSEMAILVRKNAQTRAIMQYFTEHGEDIPLISAEAFQYSSSIAIGMLINAVRFLKDEKDTVAKAFVATTYYYIQHGDLLPWESLQSGEAEYQPAAFFRQAAKLKHMPLYELFEQLVEIFHFEKFGDNSELAGQSAFVMSFLDEVVKYLQTNTSSIDEFLDYWETSLINKAIPSSKADGISIVTIHKSKGLAYHTVLVPFSDWDLDKETTVPGNENYLWCDKPEVAAEGSEQELLGTFPTLPVSLRHSTKVQSSAFKTYYEAEKKQRRIDSINMAYVAYTRPKQNLVIWAATSKSKKEKKDKGEAAALTTFGDVVMQVLEKFPEREEHADGTIIYEIGTLEPVAAEKQRATTGQPENPFKVVAADKPWTMRTYPSHVQFVQSNASREFFDTPDEEESEQQQFIRKGNLYHYILSRITTASDVKAAIQDLVAQGVIQAADASEIRKFISGRLKGKAAPWFAEGWVVNNECTLLFKDAQGRCRQRRPDRVIMRGNEVVVIDFKFARPKSEHKSQVADYIGLLQKMMPAAEVSGYLWYVYTDDINKI